jgi:predicted small integral membrane protein
LILILLLGWLGRGLQHIFYFYSLMCYWHVPLEKNSAGSPRKGILGLETTRGDRLFVSLLGSVIIHLTWLGLTDMTLWIAMVILLLYSVAVFKYV